MKKSARLILPAALACALALLACRAASAPAATPTTAPTAAPTPTPPDAAPPPTLLDEVRRVGGGGFSFRAIEGYMAFPLDGYSAVLSRDDERVEIYLDHWSAQEPFDLEEFFTRMLDGFNVDDLQRGATEAITIDGRPALAADLTWRESGAAVAGRFAAASQGGSDFFTVLLVARDGAFEPDGRAAFEALLPGLRLFPPERTACTVAGDPAYAYSEANPVRVGGGAWDGPSRERAYLSALAGPNGEAITFERLGSQPYGDTILDIYEIRYGESVAVIYVDEYAWEPPLAPAGFTCLGDFPFSAP